MCQECAKGDWDTFNEMLLSTPVGNNGLLGKINITCKVEHF